MKKIVISSLFIVISSFFSSPVLASTETTFYFGSVEKNLESGEQKVYYGAGNASAVRSSPPTGGSSVSYLHGDWLGSTVLVTRQDGIKDSSIIYYPYGKETSPPAGGPSKTDKFYTGQRKDLSSDLYFYNARYYNPKTGRFISADELVGPNRYKYVKNNPLMLIDPTGKITQEELTELVKEFNEGLSDQYKISIVLISPSSVDTNQKMIYQFMNNHAFSAMTHEDIPMTRDFSCYPNCQFWRTDTLGPISKDRARKLLVHEATHNIQARSDPQLAEHFRGEAGKGVTQVNRAYQALLEGFAEERSGGVGRGAYLQYRAFYQEIKSWAHAEYDVVGQGGYPHGAYIKLGVFLEIARKIKEGQFSVFPFVESWVDWAAYGNWEFFQNLMKIYDVYHGEGAFMELFNKMVIKQS